MLVILDKNIKNMIGFGVIVNYCNSAIIKKVCFTTDKIWKSEDKDVINIMIKDIYIRNPEDPNFNINIFLV